MRRITSNTPVPSVAGLAILFVFVAWLTLFPWRTFVPHYDLEWDTRNAVALLHHGIIPAHGGVASFFAINPPGVTAGMLPGMLLFPTEPALAERISSLVFLAAPFTVVLLRVIFRPALAHVITATLVVMVASNPTMNWKIRSLRAGDFRAAPTSEFNQVIDYVAAQARAQGRSSLSIGYDVPFLKWIVCARATDGMSKVGSQYDLVFLLRHGITNTDTRAEGVSPEDDFRIVELNSEQSWRQTLFDLSSYPRMDVIFETRGYTVLRKRAN